MPPCQRAEEARREARRSGDDLHAHDPRSRLCDARLHPPRRYPFGCVRRLLPRRAGRPHRRLQVDLPDHRRRGPARRQDHPAQGQCRPGDRDRRTRRHRGGKGPGGAPHRRQDRLGRRPRPLVPRRGGDGEAGLQAGEDEGRGPAVHPLHLGFDRQAEGGPPHHRRLPRLRLDDPPIRLRLPATATSTGARPMWAG